MIFHPFEVLEKLKRKRKPQPLPFSPIAPQRRRALTIPLPDNAHHGRKKQRTNSQSQSLFFSRLPLEVRLQIYEYVLASPEILHVMHVARPDRLRSVRCREATTQSTGMGHKCTLPNFVPSRVGYLNILYTCRQIYSESINILYTKTTLAINSAFVLENLPNAMPPHRLNSIRNISLEVNIMSRVISNFRSRRAAETSSFWGESVFVLRQMAETGGLRHLEVRVWFFDRPEGTERDMGPNDDFLFKILYSLSQVQAPNFTVMMHNWPQSVDDVRRILGGEPRFSLEVFDGKTENFGIEHTPGDYIIWRDAGAKRTEM